MLSEQEGPQKQTDAKALKAWWNSTKDKPFVLPRRKNYDVCSILFPTLCSWIRFHIRYLVIITVSKVPSSVIKILLYRRMGVNIGKGVYISPWVFLDPMFPELIELKDGCFLGGGCKLLTHEYTANNFRIGKISIGNNSVIGAFSIIRSGVSIGCNVTTGLGCVVVRNIEDSKIAIGNPARILRGTENNTWDL